MTQDTIVIGAGPAGIGAALALGPRALVLERRDHVGGLSASIDIDGAMFDLGGHSFHTPHPHIRDLVFGALDMYEQPRDARCFSHGTLIPYPFQKHFTALDAPDVVRECEEGLRLAGGAAAANFEEYITVRFGPGIAKHFMLPYNRKLWGPDLRRLSADWTSERVAVPKTTTEKFETTGGQRKPLQDDTRVAYPARGGFGEIFTALARRISDVRLEHPVASVDLKARRLYLADGTAFGWERLVSTMCLLELLARIDGVPDDIRAAAGTLEYSSLHAVFVVVDYPVRTPIQRVYVAGDESPGHKLAVNHNSSEWLRRRPRQALMAEVSSAPGKPSPGPGLEQRVIEGFVTLGLLEGPEHVVSARRVDVKYSYPIPTHGRDAAVARIKAYLEEHDVHTVGRFGEWAYVNSDESLHRGLLLGRRLAT